MIQGAEESLGKSAAMNIFTASPHADAFLTEPKPVLLPKLKACSGNVLTTNLASSESDIATKKRNSKGCQALPIIRDLLSNPECWFDIKGSSDYQFPGKLECECNMFCMYRSLPKECPWAEHLTSLPKRITSGFKVGSHNTPTEWNDVPVSIV